MSNQHEPINPRLMIDEYGHARHDVHIGLTKREYFAGLAMQGYCSSKEFYAGTHQQSIAQASVDMADALLIELGKTK